MLSRLEELLGPYDHEIIEKGMMYWVRLEQAVMSFDLRTLLHFESPTYDIHHTEECLKGQKAFFEFRDFISEFGGWVPTPSCDCPRDEIPPDPTGKAEMIFRNLLHKHQSSVTKVKET